MLYHTKQIIHYILHYEVLCQYVGKYIFIFLIYSHVNIHYYSIINIKLKNYFLFIALSMIYPVTV